MSDFLVDVIRFDREIGPLRLEVPDLLEVRAVGGRVEVVAAVLAMPAVEGVLQLLAAVEQRTVPWPELVQQFGEAAPEHPGLDVRAGQRLVLDEAEERLGDGEARDFDVVLAHGSLLVAPEPR